MRRALAALAMLPPALLPFAARAAPNWKKAPNAPEGGEQSSFNFSFETEDWEAKYGETVAMAMQFLADNYGYFGVAFVLLALFLFGRGSSARKQRVVTDEADDEDYFEPEDYRRYDPRR